MNIQNALMLGARLEAQGSLEAAQAQYRDIVAQDPACHAAWHAQGLLALRANRAPAAALCIARAARLCPTAALYHRHHGDVCRKLGQYERAIASARTAVAIDPVDADSLHSLGLSLHEAHRHDEAVWAFRLATQARPGLVDAWYSLAVAYGALGAHADSRAVLERAVALDPQHALAQNFLGVLLRKAGRIDDAINCFSAAIRARPAFVEAHANLAAVKCYLRGDPHVALLEALDEVSDSLCPQDQVHLRFAVGKSRRDTGQAAPKRQLSFR
jgi:tetratricopeptide (TPR) repeat protein